MVWVIYTQNRHGVFVDVDLVFESIWQFHLQSKDQRWHGVPSMSAFFLRLRGFTIKMTADQNISKFVIGLLGRLRSHCPHCWDAETFSKNKIDFCIYSVLSQKWVELFYFNIRAFTSSHDPRRTISITEIICGNISHYCNNGQFSFIVK